MAKAKQKLKLHNERMLLFMDYCITNKVKGIKNESEFLKRIDYEYVSNIQQLRLGIRGFRIEHFGKCCEVFGADANYFINKKYTQMLAKDKPQSALTLLRQGVIMVSQELSELQSK